MKLKQLSSELTKVYVEDNSVLSSEIDNLEDGLIIVVEDDVEVFSNIDDLVFLSETKKNELRKNKTLDCDGYYARIV